MVTGSGHTVWGRLSQHFPNLWIEKCDILSGTLPWTGGVGHFRRRAGCWHGSWIRVHSEGSLLSVMLKAGWDYTFWLVSLGRKLCGGYTKLPPFSLSSSPGQRTGGRESGWSWRHFGIRMHACTCPCHSMMLLPSLVSWVHPVTSPERWHSNYNCSRISEELVEFFRMSADARRQTSRSSFCPACKEERAWMWGFQGTLPGPLTSSEATMLFCVTCF